MKNNTITFLWIAISFLLVAFSTNTLVDYENSRKSLQIDNDNKQHKIDSLYNDIDSLCSKINDLQGLYDACSRSYHSDYPQFVTTKNDILSAIMFIESSYNDSAYCASEDAVGCLQIRQTMVKDINRILKKRKNKLRFTYEDRWSRDKSIQMFNIYCKYYNLITAEEIARCWNGGPRGMKNKITTSYWEKVKNKLNS